MFIWNFIIVLKSSIFSSPNLSLSFWYLSSKTTMISSNETLTDHEERAIMYSGVIWFLGFRSVSCFKKFSDSYKALSLRSLYSIKVGSTMCWIISFLDTKSRFLIASSYFSDCKNFITFSFSLEFGFYSINYNINKI